MVGHEIGGIARSSAHKVGTNQNSDGKYSYRLQLAGCIPTR